MILGNVLEFSEMKFDSRSDHKQSKSVAKWRALWWDNYFTEMCSGSEAGSYLRLIDFVYHSTLGLRVIKKKKKYVSGGGSDIS